MPEDPVRASLERAIDGGAIPPFVYCYPPRSSYRQLASSRSMEAIWREDLEHSLTRELNLYLHVPFCRYKCGFCNLYTVTSTDEELYDAYVDALCRELYRHAPIIQERSLRTVYIGGGTPSLLSPRHFDQLFDALDDIYPNWRPVVDEVCIEATPDSIVQSPSTISDLIGRGLTRVNMGVQSLEADELKEAGRTKADREAIIAAASIVKDLRLPNLSTDLIMGFAGQTDESWVRSVERLIQIDPETISTYFLTVRPDAWFSRTGHYKYQRSPDLYHRYDLARERIEAAGFVQESNVRYKKMGLGGYRQKVLQFRGVPVMGIGVGARTYTNTVDYIFGGSSHPSANEVHDYIRQARDGGVRITAGFVYDDVERIRKRFALDLFDLDIGALERYEYSEHESHFARLLAACVELGLGHWVGPRRFQLTSRGYKYRDVISWMCFSEVVLERDKEFYGGLHHDNVRAVERIGRDVEVSGLQLQTSARR